MLHLGAVEAGSESLQRHLEQGGQGQPPQGGQGQPPQGGQRQPPQGGQGGRGQPPQGGPPGGPGQSPGGRPPRDDSGISRRAVVAGIGVLGVGGAGAWILLSDDEDESTGDTGSVRETLRKQARALENDNIEAYMETIHPESPLYDSTRSATSRLMERYDLEIELTINSVSIDSDTATADVTQVTRAVNSASYQPRRAEMSHELRTDDGTWKVYDSSIQSREAL